jgi:hypothetical protein
MHGDAMKTLTLALAVPVMAAILIAAPARSAVVAPEASAGGWVAPVAGAFAAVGSQNIAALGSRSLTALSTLGDDARYRFAAAPQTLGLLAAHLESRGATPASFAALPAQDQIAVLRSAAADAEIEAQSIAQSALWSLNGNSFHPGTMDRASAQAARAEAVSPYLDARQREEVAQARSRVDRFIADWSRHVDEFNRDLPGKIAAGVFDNSKILVETVHGTIAADESPDPLRDDDLPSFYNRRIKNLQSAPKGPWIPKEANSLMESLRLYGPSRFGVMEPWAVQAEKDLMNLAASHDNYRLQLEPAKEAFYLNVKNGSAVAPRHILAVEAHYEKNFETLFARRVQRPTTLRVLASMRNGDGALPSWPRFLAIKSAAAKRLRIAAIASAGVWLLGMLSAFLVPKSLACVPFVLIGAAALIVARNHRDLTLFTRSRIDWWLAGEADRSLK